MSDNKREREREREYTFEEKKSFLMESV